MSQNCTEITYTKPAVGLHSHGLQKQIANTGEKTLIGLKLLENSKIMPLAMRHNKKESFTGGNHMKVPHFI